LMARGQRRFREIIRSPLLRSFANAQPHACDFFMIV